MFGEVERCGRISPQFQTFSGREFHFGKDLIDHRCRPIDPRIKEQVMHQFPPGYPSSRVYIAITVLLLSLPTVGASYAQREEDGDLGTGMRVHLSSEIGRPPQVSILASKENTSSAAAMVNSHSDLHFGHFLDLDEGPFTITQGFGACCNTNGNCHWAIDWAPTQCINVFQRFAYAIGYGTVVGIQEQISDPLTGSCGKNLAYDGTGGGGNYVVLRHVLNTGEVWHSVVKHLAHNGVTPFVAMHGRIAARTPLARMGTTGDSTGVHLHAEVRKEPAALPSYLDCDAANQLTNPLTFINDDHHILVPFLHHGSDLPGSDTFEVFGVAGRVFNTSLTLTPPVTSQFERVAVLANPIGPNSISTTLLVSVNSTIPPDTPTTYSGTTALEAGDYLVYAVLQRPGGILTTGYPLHFAVLPNEASKIVDNDGPSFGMTTPEEAVNVEGYYLSAKLIPSNSHARAFWQPLLRGAFNIEVYVPNDATAPRVFYEVCQNTTDCTMAEPIDHLRNRGQWVKLKNPNGEPWVLDLSGIVSTRHETLRPAGFLGVDAVKFVPAFSGDPEDREESPLSPPSDLRVTAITSTAVSLTWSDNSNDETAFELAVSKDGNTFFVAVSTNATVATVNGLTPSTRYLFRVRAVSDRQSSEYSSSVAANTHSISSCDSLATEISVGKTTTGALETTDCVSKDRSTSYMDMYSFKGTEGKKYLVKLRSAYFDSFLIVKKILNGVILEQDDNGGGATDAQIAFTPQESTDYIVQVLSSQSFETGEYTLSVFTQGQAAIPARPTNLEIVKVSVDSVGLTWKDNSNNETGFGIEISENELPWIIHFKTRPNQASYTLTGLDTSAYRFRVYATNPKGRSQYSNEVGVVLDAIGDAVPYNEVRQKSSHNSYDKKETILDQLVYHRIRSLEFDLFRKRFEFIQGNTVLVAAPAGDWFVFHVPGGSFSRCELLSECLDTLLTFNRANPMHEVITVWLDLKYESFPGSGPVLEESPMSPNDLDDLIRGYFKDDVVFRPRDIGCGRASLQESLRVCGWPSLSNLRGKLIFVLTDPGGAQLRTYQEKGGTFDRTAFVAPAISDVREMKNHPDAVFFNIDGGKKFVLREFDDFIVRAWGLNKEDNWKNALAQKVHHLATDKVNYHKDIWAQTHNKKGWPFECFDDCGIPEEQVMVLGVEVESGDIWDKSDDFLFAYEENDGANNVWTTYVSSANSWFGGRGEVGEGLPYGAGKLV